ncbi:DUF742 domain-containing protein [Marinactinospora thermotolerans]|uniref:DUF742 domain-containing protein n=1 Tax=Marinactinospora thermotolerans TaxID=531310 RepID=UPI003D89C8AD
MGDGGRGPARLLRPFALGLGGGAATSLDLLCRVVAARSPGETGACQPERETVLRLCLRPRSVAEVSAVLDIPLTAARLLLADMIGRGELRSCADGAKAVEEGVVLRAVLDGLRAL